VVAYGFVRDISYKQGFELIIPARIDVSLANCLSVVSEALFTVPLQAVV
jgi:hypothetical protein